MIQNYFSVYNSGKNQAYTYAPSIKLLKPQFGCRSFAYISSDPKQEGQDEFLRQILVKGGNSMKRQNQLPFTHPGDIQKAADDDFQGIVEAEHKKTGWGLAFTKSDEADADAYGMALSRSPLPIHQSKDQFEATVEDLATQKPKTMLGFLREADKASTEEVIEANTHPIPIGDWALIHHGTLPKSLTQALEQRLRVMQKMNPDIPLPKTELDSERLACFIGARFLMNYGSLNISNLTSEQIKQELKATHKMLRNFPGKDKWSEYEQILANTCTYNIIISDGKRLFGMKDTMKPDQASKLNIYVGSHANKAKKQDIVLATEKLQPLPDSGQGKIEWKPIPNHNVFSIDFPSPVKAAKKHYTPEFLPLY
jgi:predicted glutamine amidotransferase